MPKSPEHTLDIAGILHPAEEGLRGNVCRLHPAYGWQWFSYSWGWVHVAGDKPGQWDLILDYEDTWAEPEELPRLERETR